MKTIKFHTLGCKVNQYDTQSIRESFLRKGFREITNGKKADIYLINTCTVTAIADRKSREIIRRSIRLNPEAKVIATGCLVERDSLSLAGIKGLSLIVSKKFFPEGVSNFSCHTRAFLKIQDGCDNFCSYCKVPLVRGRSRSRPLSDVIAEARELARNGFKEIVLSGICLGSYGRDLSPGAGLTGLIAALEKIDGLLRIRLSSIEAADVKDELISMMAGSRKLCRHLHIPIQSGDDGILKKMNRRYSGAGYLELIRKIRQDIPEVAITTDCLVGFPGESEADFRNTLNLVKEMLPLKVHIFPYSRRPGTFAGDNFREETDPIAIRERISRLRDSARESSFAYRNRFLNREVSVLMETRTRDRPGFWEGYTDNYIKVLFRSKLGLKNQLVKVKIKKISGDFCQGG